MAAHPTNTTPIHPSNPSEYQLYQILERANLLGYFNNFIQQGGDDVRQLCEASSEEFMEILALVGMSSKPLHIRRLQKSLQEWAKENNVPYHHGQAQAAAQSQPQPQLNHMPYASALVGLHPQTGGTMGSQWGEAHTSTSSQWNPNQHQSNPSESPGQTPPYAQGVTQPTTQNLQQGGAGQNKGGGSDSEDCTDPQTLRMVAQRIMASQKTSLITQTSQNKKLLNSVQHIFEMSLDHPQRLQEIQKWAPIYGRFDSKRKDDKPLTAHEISVNEAAIQLCCIDPYLLVQRDRLFPLARQVVRESGYQFKHGHSRSVKISKSDDGSGPKAKKVKVESGVSSYSDLTTPNPRTVQAEILKLRREERMNEILINLNNIVQKQSDIKDSIAAARSEDNIQQVYDLKVQLEKLTTQQLLLMTEQTDLIKRQRRSDRYYVAKARAEEENGDPAERSNPQATPADQLTDPDWGQRSVSTAQSASPAIEGARTSSDKQLPKKPGNSDLAQSLFIQHTLMDEGLRVAQNYALDVRHSNQSAMLAGENDQPVVKMERQEPDHQEEAVNRAAESTITALLRLSSNKTTET